MRESLVALVAAGLLAGAVLSPALSAPQSRQKKPRHVERVQAALGTYPGTWEWVPADITIKAGDDVEWENPTDETHRIISWDGEWKVRTPLSPGDSTRLRFKRRGVYRYYCSMSFHGDILYLGTERLCVGMCGTITVE